MSVLPPPHEKADYVRRMFAEIAHRYDVANTAITWGLDQNWRQQVVDSVAPPVDGRVLDVGTGTGDFLPLIAHWIPDGIAIGVDFCLPMMQQGWRKLDDVSSTRNQQHTPSQSTNNVDVSDAVPPGLTTFVGGDALHLPFADNTFDVITTGFTMRNVIDIEATFRELWRVTRHGGTLACLEVARPTNALLRFGHWVYFQHIVPWIGGAISGNRRSYTYLPQSARAFPPVDELKQIMHRAGWQSVSYKLLDMGAAAIHRGIKQ